MSTSSSHPAVHSPSSISVPQETDALLDHGDAEVQRHLNKNTNLKSSQSEQSLGFLILLTLIIGGLQIAWTVELGSITPFLQELGLSKALLSLVWIAGPLSGTLMQPWVGIQSDNCRSRFGRRRPFMAGGVLATALTLVALAWTREIVDGILRPFGVDSHVLALVAQIWAVVMVYVLDFAINTIQAAVRSFIVDCVPESQQEQANAVAGIITASGAILGFLAGQADLENALGLGQFQNLCLIACVSMAITLVISCAVGQEPDPKTFGPATEGFGLVSFFRRLYRSVRLLPPQVKTVCVVEIFAWIGYFPFLFYTSTYIGNIYVQPYLDQPGDKSKEEIDRIYAEGTRRGTFALLVFSVASLVFSILLPLLVMPSGKGHADAPRSEEVDDTEMGSTERKKSLIDRLKSVTLHIPGFSLRRAWMLGHVVYAVLMWATLFAKDARTATALIALAGFPWALTQWAPFALIAREIKSQRVDVESSEQSETSGANDSETQAGIVLGIHNVAVAAPQVIATLLSSIIFKLLQKPRGVAGDDSTGWVLRLGGLCALAAAWWARRLREDR